MIQYPKRLIEVDLPIKRISAHARREKSIRHGHISTPHIGWARRPLTACRAVICSALWPDPAAPGCPRASRVAAEKIMLDCARKLTTDNTLAREHGSPANFKGRSKIATRASLPAPLPPSGRRRYGFTTKNHHVSHKPNEHLSSPAVF